jgi:hypothetical protein
MNGILTTSNFSLLTISLLLYSSSLITEIIYLMHNESDFTFYLFLIDSIISLLMILITLMLGFVSIYYSSKNKLFWYLIILFFILGFKIVLFFLILKEMKANNDNDIRIIFIITSTQIIIIFLNFISSLIERCKLIQEIEESPLNYVDENITPELYKSILSQSLNPEDKKLKNDFHKKFKKRKKYLSKKAKISSKKT